MRIRSVRWACGFWLAATTLSAQSIAFQPGAYVEVTAFVPGSSPAWLIRNTNPFIAPRLSMYGEAFLGHRIYALAELRADRGEAPGTRDIDVRLEQLFLRVSPTSALDLNLQAGKFISPFGNYPGRSHTSSDPFIRPPLSYDYRTIMSATAVPPTTARFLEWKDEPETFRSRGAPAVWGVPYQAGVLVFGTLGPLSARAAVMNSAPSSEPALWNPNGGAVAPSLVGHIAVQLGPALRLGASWDRGPYLHEETASALAPIGLAPEDFMQEIVALEFTATRGLVEVRAEVLFDRWEVPNVTEDARDRSFYAEAKWKVAPGLALATRYGRIDFNRIGDDGERWDYNMQRWQFGGMYNLTETMVARAEVMFNRGGTRDPSDNLVSVQVSRAFGARR